MQIGSGDQQAPAAADDRGDDRAAQFGTAATRVPASVQWRTGAAQRVHVIGGPGSGKTTLSRRISECICVPVFELDTVAGAGPAPDFRMSRPLDTRLAEIEEIASLPCWVTEGSFLWWTEPLMRAADVIVWLDVPARTALSRVLSRHVREYVGEIRDQLGLRGKLWVARYPHVRHLASFLPYTWSYYHRAARTTDVGPDDMSSGWALSRADTARSLEAYGRKVIRCTRPTDTAYVLKSLAAESMSVLEHAENQKAWHASD